MGFQEICKNAHSLARQALTLDPYNALTLSLLTHVYSFVLRDFDTAFELIDRARKMGSDHIMTYDTDALLNLYTGNLTRARASARFP